MLHYRGEANSVASTAHVSSELTLRRCTNRVCLADQRIQVSCVVCVGERAAWSVCRSEWPLPREEGQSEKLKAAGIEVAPLLVPACMSRRIRLSIDITSHLRKNNMFDV